MKKIRGILCATDFSEPSQRGYEYALALARRYQASLRLIHVVNPVIGDGYVDVSAVLQALEQHAAQQLTRLAFAAKTTGVPTTISVGHGSIPDVLNAEIRSHRLDLAVMGSHARHGAEKWLLGSVTENALRTLTVPILIVHANSPSPLPELKIQRILVTTDFSEGTGAAFEIAFLWRKEFGARVKALHVIPPEPSSLEPATPRQMAKRLEALAVFFREQLNNLVARQHPGGNDTEIVTEIGIPYSSILSTLARDHTDLLIINIHGKGFLDRALLGATAERVIRGAPCPVLAVPTPEHAQQSPSKQLLHKVA